jgi:hypothetical protein
MLRAAVEAQTEVGKLPRNIDGGKLPDVVIIAGNGELIKKMCRC